MKTATVAKVLQLFPKPESALDGLSAFDTRELIDASQAQWGEIDAARLPRVDDGFLVAVPQVWCELRVGEKWIAAFRISPSEPHGEPVIGEVRIFPRDVTRPQHCTEGTWKASVLGTRARCPRFGVTSQVMKQVRWGQVLALVRELLPHVQRARAVGLVTSTAWMEPFTVAPFSARRKAPGRGRPRVHSDTDYAQIAAAFLREKQAGQRAPASVVARRFKLKNAGAVRVIVQRAKDRGLVTRGRLWTLTPAALALLTAPAQRLPRIATNSGTARNTGAEVKAKPNKNARKSPRGNNRA